MFDIFPKLVTPFVEKPTESTIDVCKNCKEEISKSLFYPYNGFHVKTGMLVCTDINRKIMVDTEGFTMFARSIRCQKTN